MPVDKEIRKIILWLPQAFLKWIYHGITKKGNIDGKEWKKVIELTKYEFIYDLKDRLQTEVGERGIRLSSGQRQCIAIAKVFLRKLEIILLDEPTSLLDSFSEEAITEALNNLFKWRTVVIIAHRLQTAKKLTTLYY